MKEIQMRLYALREEMKRQKIHAWMAPTNDFHGSEYIGEYFKARRYLTGFTGSVGTAVITMEGAWLWVDGRYFVQAEKQLAGSGIILCKSGEPGVPDVENFLADSLSCGQTLGLDGRVISASEGRKLKELLGKKGILVSTGMDLVDKIWKDRPPMSKSAAWFLSREEAGESRFDKLKRVRLAMEEKGAGMHLITALDDIAWLYNMRGDDIACSPVIQAYSLIAEDRASLFVQEGALKEEQIADLLEEGIEVRKYEDILEQISALPACTLLLDPEKVSFELYRRLPEHVAVKEAQNPSVWMKAVKNPVEMEHIRTAHQKDGTAMTRFVYWVKHTAGKELVTERKAAACLEAFRKEQEGYLGPSFETISAYGENAAMCHYIATEETDKTVEPKGFLLVDAGGQYQCGTTDITRTIAVGSLSEEERLHYTLVLKGMIDLSKARFRHGFTGQQLDYMARGPLWEHGLDYGHGTGHGVGCLLNVHEPPNFIHWRLPVPMRTVFEEGMLTSNEPGYYEAGSHGIRLENLLLCRREPDSGRGAPFLYFETVTLCPIDLEGVELSLLDQDEKEWLNKYHERVYREIGPRLPREEAQWLYEATRPVKL